MAIEWTPDYCLTCDHQCPAGAAYCSQSCRLADLERASCTSSNSSPTSTTSYTSAGPSTGFYLPPAYNFPTYSHTSPTSHSSLPKSTYQSTDPAPYGYSSMRSKPSRFGIGLQAAPTRSSMGSGFNQPESPSLSDKAAQELRDYANSFDQVRDLKRRMSTV